MKKMAQIPQILKKHFPNCQILMISSVSNQEYRKILFFFILSYLVCNQIWLNYFLDDHHFDYITKSLKETMGHLPLSNPIPMLLQQTLKMKIPVLNGYYFFNN
jgi:hypothetical protein